MSLPKWCWSLVGSIGWGPYPVALYYDKEQAELHLKELNRLLLLITENDFTDTRQYQTELMELDPEFTHSSRHLQNYNLYQNNIYLHIDEFKERS